MHKTNEQLTVTMPSTANIANSRHRLTFQYKYSGKLKIFDVAEAQWVRAEKLCAVNAEEMILTAKTRGDTSGGE